MRIEPYVPHVPQPLIDDLRERLAQARFPDSLPGTHWAYGADADYMRELRDHWLHKFDWRTREAEMMRFHHFRFILPQLAIHFIHERGEGRRPFPIVLTHGWPGSFLEFSRIIPMLTHPSRFDGDPDDAFDVVVPSLPGFGFSDRPTTPGMDQYRAAELWELLMGALGYERFGAQGGDIGADVTTVLGLRHADRVTAIHLNYIPGPYSTDGDPSPEIRRFFDSVEKRKAIHGAYSHVQRNEPQTLALALNDTPIGLAAWIITKFRDWSDCGGDVETRFSRDDLLANVSLYWFTETIGSSCRWYYDGSRAPDSFAHPSDRVRVPSAIARFPKESPFPPRALVERSYNVARWTEMPRGGHFAAMEEPGLLAADLRAFFRPMRKER